MTKTFNQYLKDKGLRLKKIVENNDHSLTFVLNAPGEKDENIIHQELLPYFNFVDDITVQIEEETKENKEDFSLDAYQKKRLEEKNKEISAFKPVQKKVKEYQLNPGELVCGRAFKKEPRSIGSIDFTETVHENDVCIEGDVFSQEIKLISDKSELFTIALTDYTGSIYLKIFNSVSKEKQRALLNKYTAPGNRIKVLGSLEYDDFLSATRRVYAY